MNTHTRTALIGTVLVIILAGLYFSTRSHRADEPTTTATSTVAIGDTNPAAPAGVVTQGPIGTTVTFGNVAAPTDYAHPLAFPSSISESDRTAIQAAFDADVKKITASGDMNAWADLAILRKVTEDYRGAAQIFTYLASNYPSYSGPLASLGDLYANYLKDYPAAEANLLKAISIDSKNPQMYLSLYELYVGPYPKSNTAAEDILKKGITANPTSYQLQVELARYYVRNGRLSAAHDLYVAAAENARTQGETAVAAQIQTDADLVK